MNLFDLNGKTALVTGASSGLGRHFAKVLAAAGADVVLAARRVDRLETLAEEILKLGVRAHVAPLDVTETDNCEAALEKAEKALGTMTIVVNNAGLTRHETFLDATENDWYTTIETNLTGVRRIGQMTARRMVKSGKGGSIINIASILGLGVSPQKSSYATSKSAVIQLTKSMALELFQHNIRVNAICPGYFRTEINDVYLDSEEGHRYLSLIPPGRVGELSELSGPLLMLASDSSSFVNGSIINVDGGHSVSLV